MKNFKSIAIVSALALAVTGCASTKSMDKHTVAPMDTDTKISMQYQNKDVKFPEIKKAKFSTQNYKGSWPNWDNVAQVEHGMAKDQLYDLLGRPHFSEGLWGVKEWNYVFNYRDAEQAHKVCQFQVKFDKKMNVDAFFWSDLSCEKQMQPKATPVQQTIVQNIIQQSAPPVEIKEQTKLVESLVLGTDALFAFDKFGVSDIKGEGKAKLDDLARKIQSYEKDGKVMAFIIGHTDRLGDESYNMNLSKKRADTIAGYLLSKGVKPVSLSSLGAGELMPVKECASGTREQLIDCLQPNRRVEVQLYSYQ